MSIETMLKAYTVAKRDNCVNEEKLQYTIEKSKEAFWKSEETGETSWLEFLHQQATYIQKRWWLAQGIVLAVLWLSLNFSNSGIYERRCMGILTPCFAILLLPELWKNRSSNAMEVEGAAYFSLRKIYAARLILFAMADTCLLTIFCIVSVFTVQIAVMDFLIQFVLPLNVTCCICFQTLQSKRNLSIFSSMMFCMGWITVWVSLVLNDSIYERITTPIWIGTIVGSFICLCYSIMKIYKCSSDCYETIDIVS